MMNPEDELTKECEYDLWKYETSPSPSSRVRRIIKEDYYPKQKFSEEELVAHKVITAIAKETILAAKEGIAKKITEVESIISKSKVPENIAKFQAYAAGLRKALELLG